MDTRPSQEYEPFSDEFAHAVRKGLGARQKRLPCHFLYDARGSELFEEITGLDEYYPTRTEIGLLERCGPEIEKLAGPGCAVVEFGSGSSRKTHILIAGLERPAAYVPIDIADEALAEAAERVQAKFPALDVRPVHADFNQPIDLPAEVARLPKLGFFPGSTIGNFAHDEARQFLAAAAAMLGERSSFLVGADLKKDRDILLDAYNDKKGVTAAFNLNILNRINRQLDGDIDIEKFAHEAIYNDVEGRIEIYIVSLEDQQFSAAGVDFSLRQGERIHTENSHKYAVDEFQEMAQASGWEVAHVWSDEKALFSLHFLTRN